MLTPTVRRTLAPRGQTPILPCWDRRDRISAVSAITVSPKRKRLGLCFQLLPDNENVDGEDTVSFLKLLKRHHPGPLTIIWDRGNIHDRAKVVQKYLAKHPEIVTEKFPAYAPELDPDEYVWTGTKYNRLANFVPADIHALRRRLTSELNRLRKQPDRLRSCIKHSKLPLLTEADYH